MKFPIFTTLLCSLLALLASADSPVLGTFLYPPSDTNNIAYNNNHAFNYLDSVNVTWSTYVSNFTSTSTFLILFVTTDAASNYQKPVYNQSISNASNDSAIVSLNYGAPYQNAHFGITDPTQQGMIYNSGNFEILFNNSPNGVVWSLASLSSASASPSQSPTPTPSPQSSLSTGAKAGIAVGVIVGALVLLAAGTLILLMRKKRKAASENSYHRTRELDDGKAGKADIARTPVVEIDANTEMRTELPTGEDKMHELETDGGQAHELSGGWDSIRGLKTPTSVRGPMTPTSVHKFNTPTSIHEPTTPDSSRGSKTSISASRLKLPKSLGR